MRSFTASIILLVLAADSAQANTAVGALRALLPEQIKSVALIAGREGALEPKRWHILVYDPMAETGLREFVVDGSQVTANRQYSQFAMRLNPTDVFGPDTLKMDSDKITRLAMMYGMANNVVITTMNFDLRKGSSDGGPLWTVQCLDHSGAELGRLIISATRGNVIMHPGFSAEPPAEVGERALTGTSRTDSANRSGSPSTRKASPPKKAATPLPMATPRRNVFQRMFGGGGNTR